MNYLQAVEAYQQDPSAGMLLSVSRSLAASMTFCEKVRMLSGSFFAFGWRVILGRLLHGSVFHYPFSGSGCRRLGVPALAFSDGPRGSVTGHATCFPVAMARAAAFDPDFEYLVGTAIAREARAAGANFFAGICLNLVRNPRWGRSQESWGEDPHLLGEMASAMVRAVQDQGLIACPKHFALNSIENLRFLVSAETDGRSLREIWLPHFRKTVEAGALAMMSAYNKVNGEYCGENHSLLTRILQEEWGFDGFVMSDFIWGVHDTAAALKAGLDCEMPVPFFFHPRKVGRAIRQGKITMEAVDQAAGRILGVLIRQIPRLGKPEKTVVKSAGHLALATESARRSMVLLKNTGELLPLPGGTRLAVVGPFADCLNLGDHGSSRVVPGKEAVTAARGLRQRFGQVVVCPGTDADKVLQAAQSAEVVIACVGYDFRGEGEFLINPGPDMKQKPRTAVGGDRDTLDLPEDQLAMLAALKKTGKKVVAVLHTGSVILTGPLEPHTDALVMAWYGGVGFGDALADLLSGDHNFSAKLPLSLARNARDYPEFREIGQQPFLVDYGYYNGYWHLARQGIEPAYPFGFGLSYTGFTLEDVEATKDIEGGIKVKVTVANAGDRTGAEVIQVYIGSGGSGSQGEHRPRPMLRGFRRVELEPGQSRLVEITVPVQDLKFYDAVRAEWVLDPVYIIQVGNSSADRRCAEMVVEFD